MSGWPWWPPDELVSTEPDPTSGVWVTNHSLGLRDKNAETNVRSNEWAWCSHKKALHRGLARPWDPYLCSECLWSKRQWDPQRRRLVTRPGRYRKGDFSIQLLWLEHWGQIKGKPSPNMKWSLTKLLLLVVCSVPAPVCEQEALLCVYHMGPQWNFPRRWGLPLKIAS